MTATLAEAMDAGPVVLDGGLATLLEERGHDLGSGSSLWSARLLLEEPAAVRDAHVEYFTAGAQVAITASYQVSQSGFAAAGLDAAQCREALTASVRLAREAIELAGGAQRWVAASIGPYGATLADGSEYRGDYGLDVAALRRWHRPRLEQLIDAAPDVLALETVPCLTEAEALLAEVAGTDAPVWLALTVAGGRTRAGEAASQAFAMARDVPEVVAVGVNCCDPAEVAEAVELAAAASGKPVVVYPNSGERWDAARRAWTGAPLSVPVSDWVAGGARLVGGCCRVGPQAVRGIAAALDQALT